MWASAHEQMRNDVLFFLISFDWKVDPFHAKAVIYKRKQIDFHVEQVCNLNILDIDDDHNLKHKRWLFSVFLRTNVDKSPAPND